MKYTQRFSSDIYRGFRLYMQMVFVGVSFLHYSTSPPGVNQVEVLPPVPNDTKTTAELVDERAGI